MSVCLSVCPLRLQRDNPQVRSKDSDSKISIPETQEKTQGTCMTSIVKTPETEEILLQWRAPRFLRFRGWHLRLIYPSASYLSAVQVSTGAGRVAFSNCGLQLKIRRRNIPSSSKTCLPASSMYCMGSNWDHCNHCYDLQNGHHEARVPSVLRSDHCYLYCTILYHQPKRLDAPFSFTLQRIDHQKPRAEILSHPKVNFLRCNLIRKTDGTVSCMSSFISITRSSSGCSQTKLSSKGAWVQDGVVGV